MSVASTPRWHASSSIRLGHSSLTSGRDGCRPSYRSSADRPPRPLPGCPMDPDRGAFRSTGQEPSARSSERPASIRDHPVEDGRPARGVHRPHCTDGGDALPAGRARTARRSRERQMAPYSAPRGADRVSRAGESGAGCLAMDCLAWIAWPTAWPCLATRVGRRGLEPLTPCASCKCATNCANGPEAPPYPPWHHGAVRGSRTRSASWNRPFPTPMRGPSATRR